MAWRRALLVALIATACSTKEPTELIVLVGSDLVVPDQLRSVHARVENAKGGAPWEHTFDLKARAQAQKGDLVLPFSFAVVPHGDDPSNGVTIILEAQKDTALFSRTAKT